jgi:GR25 family glycosyltransferase involved in LPS biosynthesis
MALATTPSSDLIISAAHVIALDPANAGPIAQQAARFLRLPNVTVFPAINSSEALRSAPTLSLYTQYLLHFRTRHDHMQLSTAPMLGCLLSHMHLWAQALALNHSLIAVFEEDAVFDEVSAERFQGLLTDLNHTRWDILMLESGSLIALGPWEPMGRYAAKCALPPCSWYGTRGYLLTQRGARILLQHAYPISVQVDALIALVAAFHPSDFRMYWTRENIAHQRYAHISSIWEGCIKCYLPAGPIYYACAVAAILLLACVFFSARDRKSPHPSS